MQGASIANDFGAWIPLPKPLTGKVILEIWMDPKVGSDTNNFFSLIFDNNVGGRSAITGKNDSDRWIYKGPDEKPFDSLDGGGHNIRIEYDTETAIYDYYFDRDRDGDFDSQDFIMLNVDFGIGHAGKSLTGIGINSGRGGGGTTSYFDDLRVSVELFP